MIQLPETVDLDEPDELLNTREVVCYFIVAGNQLGAFSIDRTRHTLRVSPAMIFLFLKKKREHTDHCPAHFSLRKNWIEKNKPYTSLWFKLARNVMSNRKRRILTIQLTLPYSKSSSTWKTSTIMRPSLIKVRKFSLCKEWKSSAQVDFNNFSFHFPPPACRGVHRRANDRSGFRFRSSTRDSHWSGYWSQR